MLEYEALSAAEQRFVRQLVANGTTTAPPPVLERLYQTDTYEYVRYQGRLYDVAAECRGRIGGTTITAVTEVTESEVDEDRPRVSYDNLSEHARAVFTEALAAENESAIYWAGSFPDALEPGTVVEYDGSLYRLSIGAVDAIRCRYSIEPVDD